MTRSIGANLRSLAMTMALAFLVTSVGVGYWTLAAGDELSRDPFNPRLVEAAAKVARGEIVDRDGVVLARSDPVGDGFRRTYAGALFLAAGGYHHHIGLNTWARGRTAPAGATGLVSYAWRIPAGAVDALEAHLRARAVPHGHADGTLALTDPVGIRVDVTKNGRR